MSLSIRLIPAIWFAETLCRPFFILLPPGPASSSRSHRNFERGEFFQHISLDLAPEKNLSAFFSPDYYTAPVLSVRFGFRIDSNYIFLQLAVYFGGLTCDGQNTVWKDDDLVGAVRLSRSRCAAAEHLHVVCSDATAWSSGGGGSRRLAGSCELRTKAESEKDSEGSGALKVRAGGGWFPGSGCPQTSGARLGVRLGQPCAPRAS